MKLRLLLLHLVLFVTLHAQIRFEKIFDYGLEEGFAVQQTSDGGYIVAGYQNVPGSQPYTTSQDLCLTKTDMYGNQVWSKNYGGEFYDRAQSVEQTTDGGYIVTGRAMRTGNPFNDVYLIKTDSEGDTLWTRMYGGVRNDKGEAVVQTTDGGYAIAGTTDSYGSVEAYLIKTNVDGDTMWTKTYGSEYGTISGYSIQQTADGGYIIAGYSQKIFVGDFYLILIKIYPNGEREWIREYGDGDGISYQAYSVRQTTDGGYIVAGTITTAADVNMYVMKTNVNGDTLWAKSYGGSGVEEGHGIRQSTDGGYIIIGDTYSFGSGYFDAYLVKTDESGNVIWTRAIGGADSDHGNAVAQTSDGGFVFTGINRNSGNDGYLVKTDALGNLVDGFGDFNNMSEMLVYPNPAHDFISISNLPLSQTSALSVELIDLRGRIFKIRCSPEQMACNELKISCFGYTPGIYFYRVKNGSLLLGFGKVMID